MPPTAPMSVRSAVDLLTSVMQDPEREKICCFRISLAADRIDQELETCANLAEKIKFAKSLPGFLRTGIKFITTNQTPRAHISMVQNLTTCPCDMTQAAVRNLHLPSRSRPNRGLDAEVVPLGMLYDAVNTLCNCIVLAITDLSKHKFRNSSTNGVRNWPQDSNDLLPFGPQGTIKGLTLWTQAFPLGYSIFTLMGSLALFFSPFSKELLLERNHITALALPANHLRKAVVYHDASTSNGHTVYDPSAPRNITYFEKPLKATFGFLDDIKRAATFEFILMATDHGHWISDSLARLQTILATIPTEWSAKTLGQVQFMYPFSLTKSNPALGLVLGQKQYCNPEANTADKAFDHIVSVRKQGCLNTTCTMDPDEVIHLRSCAKCNLIRFCGPQCAKSAWKAVDLPHKALCPQIVALTKLFGNDWDVIWTPGYTFAEFKQLCGAKGVDLEDIRDVGFTIARLKGSKLRYKALSGTTSVHPLLQAARR